MGNYRNFKKGKPKGEKYIPPFDANLLNKPIEELNLHPICLKILKSGNINLILELVSSSEKELYAIPHFNKRSAQEVSAKLSAQGLFLRPVEVDKPAAPPKAEPVKTEPPAAKVIEKRVDAAAKEGQRLPAADKGRDKQGVKRDRNGRDSAPRGSKPEPRPEAKREPEKRNEGRPKDNERPREQQDKYVKVNKNNKWGFMDRNGKEVVAPAYDEVYGYKEDICCVELNERCGYIDRNGELVVPIIYDFGLSFSEGIACVYKAGKCGYISRNGDIVVDFKFDAGTPSENGGCRVKRDGRWGELNFADLKDAEGNPTVNPEGTIRWI